MSEGKAPYISRPMRDYLDEAASNAPTPGGGSVSALAAGLGTTMASMAANFTTGKKKFARVALTITGATECGVIGVASELFRTPEADA